MQAYLNFSASSGEQRIPCGVVTTIGRDRSNTIVLTDLQVSRHHALVRRLGEADYYLIDSGSANGSKVNARRLSTPTLLHDASAAPSFCSGSRPTILHSRIRYRCSRR